MKRSVLSVLMAFAAVEVSAATYYVDGSSPSDYDGLAPAFDGVHGPKKNIQGAVDAAGTNDTVLVAPGIYATGETVDDIPNNGVKNRVWVNKPLRITATGTAGETHIVGARASSGKWGADAVRCLTISADGVVVKGFTIRDGASQEGSNVPLSHAGGICFVNNKGSFSQGSYIVDCVVSNCVAQRGGAMAGGVAVRCLFVNNVASGGGAVLRSSSAYASVFVANGNSTNGATTDTDSCSRLVNCTFVGNPSGAVRLGSGVSCTVQNCVGCFSLGGSALRVTKTGSAVMTAEHCVFSGVAREAGAGEAFTEVTEDASPYQIASPFEGDFRILKGGPCDGTGDASSATASWLPSEFRGKDFFGNSFVVGEACNIGAVASSAEMAGGFAVFSCAKTRPPEVDLPVVYRNLELPSEGTSDVALYLGATSFPRQVYVKATPRLSVVPIRFAQSGWGTAMTDNTVPSRFVDANGGVWFMLPDSGRVVTNAAVYSESIKYVSPSGDNGNDGNSSLTPYKTLQYAVTKAKSDSLILAARGDYAEGETFGRGMTNRVYIDKNVLIRAVEGPRVTAIRGAVDSTVSSGFGLLSVRPVAFAPAVHAAVQGFTLTGGCVAADENAEPGCGGGAYGNGPKSQLLDCVIAGNKASRGGGAQAVWAIRCVFTNNVTTGQCVLRSAYGSSCLFAGNKTGGYVVSTTAYAFNCTAYETTVGSSMVGASASAYNSVFDGVYDSPNSDQERAGCYSSSFEQTGVTRTDVLLAHPQAGDFRLLRRSPAVWAGSVTEFPKHPGWFSLFTTDDLYGNPFRMTGGKMIAGAISELAKGYQGLVFVVR